MISNSGEQLGVISTAEAIRLAREQELDLVEVAPASDPPVCRILDYGKLRYLQAKKDREARKAQKSTDLREVQFRRGPHIAEHDFVTKVRKVHQLLADGDKVKVSVRFRGRQVARPEDGVQLLRRVVEGVKEEAKLDKAPSMEGRSMSIVLIPVPAKAEKKEAVESA